ncbi:hypothetical protein [Cellulomonas composti]|uniref:Tail assembly chaperone n=1 Tax=Cellulomonas composti TaxID=266130 RepID=A0A511JAQ4_9CELL|nr:hypothetical protein [Cellulomonas composti]GEL95044.1 hypothetical protein CCO02nite_17020 [Cellulomonas composti]
MSLRTRYEFTLPRGYVDRDGGVHRDGVMRLATARDELEPLRDPTITGPDDPRLTIVVLARVVESLGTLSMVTAHEIEGLFAADLAYLQDFYGVINFGSQEEFEEFVAAQRAFGQAPGVSSDETPAPAGAPEQPAVAEPAVGEQAAPPAPRPGRASIEEIRSEARQ